MTALEIGGILLASECAIAAWWVLFSILRAQRKSATADQEQAGSLLEQVTTHKATRRDALASALATTQGLDGDALAAKVDGFLAREEAFYRAMLDIYVKRDPQRLQEIPNELAKVLAPFAEKPEPTAAEREVVAAIEQAKTELATELAETKKTLEQMLDEYNAAFTRQAKAEANQLRQAEAAARGGTATAHTADAAPSNRGRTPAVKPDEGEAFEISADPARG